MRVAHTPAAHYREHEGSGCECGCATKADDAAWVCTLCGATYDNTLAEFAVFCCYDCGGGGRRNYRQFSSTVDGPLFNKAGIMRPSTLEE